tara:strand:- start:101 stop:313 length:213 start_codon:yes stop_codon:yes gene_type:complete
MLDDYHGTMDYEGIARRHIQDAEDHLRAANTTQDASTVYRAEFLASAGVHAQIAQAAATMATLLAGGRDE